MKEVTCFPNQGKEMCQVMPWVFFFSLALAAKGSASQLANSAESVGCISAVL